MGLRKYFVLVSPMVLYYTIGVIGFYLPLYARSLGASYTLVELLSTAYYVVATPVSFLYGRIADIFGKPRTLLLFNMGLNALLCMAISVSNDPYHLLILRAIQGFALAAAVPIATVIAADVLGVKSGVGLVGTFSGIAFALGSIAGGLLIAYVNYSASFMSVSFFSIIAFILILLAEMPEHTVGDRESDVKRMLKDLRLMPFSLIIIYLSLALRNLGASGVFVILSVFIKEYIGASMIILSIAMSVNPTVQALFMKIASNIAFKRERFFYALGMLLTGLVFLGYVMATGIEYIIVANMFLGIAWSFIMVSGNMYIVRNAPEKIRYTAVSLFTTSFNASWIMGTIIAGPVMDSHGIISWIKISLLLALLASVIALLIRPSEKTLRSS